MNFDKADAWETACALCFITSLLPCLIRRPLQYNRSYVVKMNAKRHLATSQPCWTFAHPNRAPIIDNRRACRLTFVAEADGTVRSFGAKIAIVTAGSDPNRALVADPRASRHVSLRAVRQRGHVDRFAGFVHSNMSSDSLLLRSRNVQRAHVQLVPAAVPHSPARCGAGALSRHLSRDFSTAIAEL